MVRLIAAALLLGLAGCYSYGYGYYPNAGYPARGGSPGPGNVPANPSVTSGG